MLSGERMWGGHSCPPPLTLAVAVHAAYRYSFHDDSGCDIDKNQIKSSGQSVRST